MARVLIVGAGLSGLSAARELQQRGHDALIVDKARGVGGRMATRRIGEATFDHGAQFFTARRLAFKNLVAQWLYAGVAQQWFDGYPSPRDVKSHDVYPRYRGVGGMTSLCKWLARDLEVHLNVEIVSLRRDASGWTAHAQSGKEYSGDKLLLTAPIPQALKLLDTSREVLPSPTRQTLENIGYDPCFAVLALLDGASKIPPPGALYVNEEPIAWLADNYQKGVSARVGAVTIHSTGAFAARHFDDDRTVVGTLLLDAAREYLGASVVEFQVQRWRYSKPQNPLSAGALFIPELQLAFAGDAFNSAKVEGAFLSGAQAAQELAEDAD